MQVAINFRDKEELRLLKWAHQSLRQSKGTESPLRGHEKRKGHIWERREEYPQHMQKKAKATVVVRYR